MGQYHKIWTGCGQWMHGPLELHFRVPVTSSSLSLREKPGGWEPGVSKGGASPLVNHG